MTAKTTLIREALAKQLKNAIPKMNATPFPDDTKAPRFVVNDTFDAINYMEPLANGDVIVRYEIVVELAGTDATAQARRMEEILSWDGSESVYAAIVADRTLGNVVGQTLVSAANRNPDEPDRATIPVEIRTSKT